MPVNAPRNDFPNIPQKLIRAVQKAGSERRFARMRNVNISYLSNLLRRGEEPTDRTEKGQEVRVRLFLPRKKQKRGTRRKLLPGEWHMQRKIGKMLKATNNAVVRRKGGDSL